MAWVTLELTVSPVPAASSQGESVSPSGRVSGCVGASPMGLPNPFLHSQILKLLKGKVVVGHALHNDFQALKYFHPRSQTRDTTYVPNFLSQPGLHTRTRVSLKDLALQLLHKKIQVCGVGVVTGRGKAWGGAASFPSPGSRGWDKAQSPRCTGSPGCFSPPAFRSVIVTASRICASSSAPCIPGSVPASACSSICCSRRGGAFGHGRQ